MTKSKFVLSIAIVVSVIFTLLLMVQSPTPMSATELNRSQPPSLPVRVAAVTSGPVRSALVYSGNIKAAEEVRVLPKVSGRIVELNVDVGDPVTKDQVIARIETETAAAQLLQAYANLQLAKAKLAQMQEGSRKEQIAQAEAAVKREQARLERLKAPLDPNEIAMAKAQERQAKAALEQAQAAYDKIAWYDAKGLMPQSLALQQATIAYEAARAAYEEKLAGAKPEDIRAQEAAVEAAKSQLALAKIPYRDSDFEIARANVLQAQAVVYAAQLQLKECTIRAPMDGVISESLVSVGSVVGPTTPVVTIVTPNVEVAVKVEESRIAEIKRGQLATLKVAAFPDEEFQGVIDRIAPTADPTDRTFLIKIVPKSQDYRLRAGMFAEVNLITEQHANALVIPQVALVRDGDRAYVYVVTNGAVERREVTLGLRDGDKVQVLSGVLLGEQVVIAGQQGLKDGALVKVVNQG